MDSCLRSVRPASGQGRTKCRLKMHHLASLSYQGRCHERLDVTRCILRERGEDMTKRSVHALTSELGAPLL